MAQQWFIQRRSGVKAGPFSPRELKNLAHRGELSPDDLVWNEELDHWVPAGRIRGLFEDTSGNTGELVLWNDQSNPEQLAISSGDQALTPQGTPPLARPEVHRESTGEGPGWEPGRTETQPRFGRPSRRRQTFEGSPTTFARSRETLGRHVLDRWLAFLRTRFGSEFLQASQHLFLLCGRYGLLTAVALILTDSLFVSQGMDASSLLWTLSICFFLFVGHYLSARVIFVLDRWELRIRAQLASSVVPDGMSLLSMLIAVVSIVMGTVYALSTGFVDLIFYAVALSIWGLFTSIQFLDLDDLQIAINPDLSPMEELIGLFYLAGKMVARLCPVIFGVLVLLGNLHLALGLLFTLNGSPAGEGSNLGSDLIPQELAVIFAGPAIAGWGLGQSGLVMVVAASLWPAVSYLLYLFGQLIIACLAALLALFHVENRNLPHSSELSKREFTDG
uniref:GYF domain-containing protein n=1 Tax=uncultured Planctomycetota bacterium TaxID=120965 RepID=H5SAS5_9BACT|nr:hypothetical protein HGMM_F06C06C06 [uncultured Planctomycetota bacterium]